MFGLPGDRAGDSSGVTSSLGVGEGKSFYDGEAPGKLDGFHHKGHQGNTKEDQGPPTGNRGRGGMQVRLGEGIFNSYAGDQLLGIHIFRKNSRGSGFGGGGDDQGVPKTDASFVLQAEGYGDLG